MKLERPDLSDGAVVIGLAGFVMAAVLIWRQFGAWGGLLLIAALAMVVGALGVAHVWRR